MARELLGELQPGDVVRVVGQDLTWAVLFLEYPIVNVDAKSGISRGDSPDGARLWNDVHGVHTFGLDVLERIA